MCLLSKVLAKQAHFDYLICACSLARCFITTAFFCFAGLFKIGCLLHAGGHYDRFYRRIFIGLEKSR